MSYPSSGQPVRGSRTHLRNRCDHLTARQLHASSLQHRRRSAAVPLPTWSDAAPRRRCSRCCPCRTPWTTTGSRCRAGRPSATRTTSSVVRASSRWTRRSQSDRCLQRRQANQQRHDIAKDTTSKDLTQDRNWNSHRNKILKYIIMQNPEKNTSASVHILITVIHVKACSPTEIEQPGLWIQLKLRWCPPPGPYTESCLQRSSTWTSWI